MNNYKQIQKILKDVPDDLPFYLRMLTTAGHLQAAGYAVQEESFLDEGCPARAIIFTPVFIGEDDDTEKIDGHIDMMFEVRVNVLQSIQETAKDCNVNYRTIQRWRDEKKIPLFKIGGKQVFASEIVRDYAAKQGHLPGRLFWG